MVWCGAVRRSPETLDNERFLHGLIVLEEFIKEVMAMVGVHCPLLDAAQLYTDFVRRCACVG